MSNFSGYGGGYQYGNDLPQQQQLDPYSNISNDPYNQPPQQQQQQQHSQEDEDQQHHLQEEGDKEQKHAYGYGVGYHDHDPYENSGVGGYDGEYSGYGEPDMPMRTNVSGYEDFIPDVGGTGIGTDEVEGVGEVESTVEDADVEGEESAVDFDHPGIANLPRILLMGPRRAGKTSIQRVLFHKMSPHETLFRLEATQSLERSIVDHTPLCRFTIYDFPGDYYGPEVAPSAGSLERHLQQEHQLQEQQQHPGFPTDNDGIRRLQPYNSIAMQQQHHHQQQHYHQQQHEDDPSSLQPPQHHNLDIPSPPATPEIDPLDAQTFGRATALIFVLDAQDEPYDHVLQHFTETVKRAARANPHIAIEVFINKVDGELFLSDEAKYDCRRDVMQQVTDELADAGVMPDSVPISYHLTSIYDHSVFEAFSRVVQKLIPQLPTLENLLNVLVSTCSMEKAYLFDVATKLYIGTDSSPVDMQSVELCSDMIDVVLDVSGIYGLGNESNEDEHPSAVGLDTLGESEIASASAANLAPGSELVSLNSGDAAKVGGSKVGTATGSPAAAEDTGEGINNGSNNAGDVLSQFAGDSVTLDYGKDGKDELVGTLISQGAGAIEGDRGNETEEADADSAYDSESASVIRLSNGMILYMKEVDTMLALVCLTRAENFRKKGLINYNIGCLKKALRALVQPTSEL